MKSTDNYIHGTCIHGISFTVDMIIWVNKIFKPVKQLKAAVIFRPLGHCHCNVQSRTVPLYDQMKNVKIFEIIL